MQIYNDLISWLCMSMFFFFLSLCVCLFVVWKWKMNLFIQMLKKIWLNFSSLCIMLGSENI